MIQRFMYRKSNSNMSWMTIDHTNHVFKVENQDMHVPGEYEDDYIDCGQYAFLCIGKDVTNAGYERSNHLEM